MSIFKTIKGGNAAAAPRAERFFGEVMAIHPKNDPPSMLVRHAETGKEITVTLDREVKIAVTEGRSRPEIVDFTRGKMKTAVGGFVRIEGAVEDKATGMYKARWITGAIHDPSEGRVATIEGRVSPLLKREGGGEYRMLDQLDSSAAKRVTNQAELQEALAAAIRSHGTALIRYSDCVEEHGSRTISGGARTLPEAERVSAALANKHAVALLDAAGQLGPTDVIEVVPVRRYFFGGDSAKHKSLDQYFCESTDNGRLRDKGFATVLVSFFKHEDGTEFVTSATPKGFGFKPEGRFITEEANISAKKQPAEAPAPAASGGVASVESGGGSAGSTASSGEAAPAANPASAAAPEEVQVPGFESDDVLNIDALELEEILSGHSAAQSTGKGMNGPAF